MVLPRRVKKKNVYNFRCVEKTPRTQQKENRTLKPVGVVAVVRFEKDLFNLCIKRINVCVCHPSIYQHIDIVFFWLRISVVFYEKMREKKENENEFVFVSF